MDIMTAIKPLLKHRFTSAGMRVEAAILDRLGDKYYGTDRVGWEAHRRHGYHMWMIGKDEEDIAFYHELPLGIVKWWIKIWSMYTNAWNFIK